MSVIFVSGHLDLLEEEFAAHYIPRLDAAITVSHSDDIAWVRPGGHDRARHIILRADNQEFNVMSDLVLRIQAQATPQQLAALRDLFERRHEPEAPAGIEYLVIEADGQLGTNNPDELNDDDAGYARGIPQAEEVAGWLSAYVHPGAIVYVKDYDSFRADGVRIDGPGAFVPLSLALATDDRSTVVDI